MTRPYLASGKQHDSSEVITDNRFTVQKEDGSGLMYYYQEAKSRLLNRGNASVQNVLRQNWSRDFFSINSSLESSCYA